MFSEQVTVNIATSKLRCKLAEGLVAMTELKNNSLYDLMVNGLPYLLSQGERSVVVNKVGGELLPIESGDIYFLEDQINFLESIMFEIEELMSCGYTPLSAYLNATLDITTEEMPHPEFGAYWYPLAWKTAKLLRELKIERYGDKIIHYCSSREEFLKCVKYLHTLPNIYGITFQEDGCNWYLSTDQGFSCSVALKSKRGGRKIQLPAAIRIIKSGTTEFTWMAHCGENVVRKGDSIPYWLEDRKDLLKEIEELKG
jgi:hypothetical protein